MELKKILSVVKGNRLLFLLGALGLLLLLFSPGGDAQEATPSPLETAEAYRLSLERSVKALCEQVEGVGEAYVFVSLASTEIAVYEKNQSGESETVANAGGGPLLLAYRLPEVAGVSVVCTGGGDALVQKELVSLLRTSLSIGTSQIHIAPLK